MSKSRVTNPAADTPDPTAGPGHRLAAERLSRGIDIDRVAALLHLRRTIVEALEDDRYEQLPDPVFVAGYLRNYARLLSIDPAPIVDAYKDLVPDLQPSVASVPLPPDPEPAPRQGGLLVRAAVVATIGAAVGLLALWWQGQRPNLVSEPSAASTPANMDQTLAAPPGEGSGSGDASPAGALAPDKVISSGDAQPSTTPAPQSGTTPPANSQATAPAAATGDVAADEDFGASGTAIASTGPGQVELEFTGASWIDVRGADGKLVLNGEMRAGDRRTLSGRPPFKLVIGNAAATRMTVDGQPFDLQSRARGNVARFTLDPSATR